jgi:hypothetical protein
VSRLQEARRQGAVLKGVGFCTGPQSNFPLCF